ncbi:hypothetical protein [Nitratireductor mangrovi]|uniref:hypothetical protein n=1 Tax=Nitratireductor mangrovi TaxID=2599600 RepID=UPI001FEFC90B|nr:hypothetical protein [Nitratireductor mangrovi]
MTYLRIGGQEAGRELGETSLAHPGLGLDRGDKASHKLDVAVDLAFESGADKANLTAYLGAKVALEDRAILAFRKHTGCRDHHESDQRRYVREPEYGFPDFVEGWIHPPCCLPPAP